MDEWRISLELDPTEIPALQNALLGVIPDERHALITSGWEEDPEDAYLSITVAADSEQSATRQAVGLYAEVRTAAGLGPAEPQIIACVAPFFMGPARHRLRTEAAQLFAQGRHALAVVRAQTAVEIYVRVALEDLLFRRGGDALVTELRNVQRSTFGNPPTRGLFFLLTGHRVEEQHWWPDYRRHLTRRNGVVHEGWAVGERDARESLDVAEKLHSYVEDAWADAI